MTLKRPAMIDGSLYDEFKKEVARLKGFGDNVIKEALEEAVSNWIRRQRG
jgi:hypothetical protein